MTSVVYLCAHCGRQSIRVLRCEDAERVRRACEVARSLPWTPDGFYFAAVEGKGRLERVTPESVTFWFAVGIGIAHAKLGDVWVTADGEVVATVEG